MQGFRPSSYSPPKRLDPVLAFLSLVALSYFLGEGLGTTTALDRLLSPKLSVAGSDAFAGAILKGWSRHWLNSHKSNLREEGGAYIFHRGGKGIGNTRQLVTEHPQSGSRERGMLELSPPSPLQSPQDPRLWNGFSCGQVDPPSLHSPSQTHPTWGLVSADSRSCQLDSQYKSSQSAETPVSELRL